MPRNAFHVTLLVLVLAITLPLSSNISFAEDEHVSDSHAEEAEESISTHTAEGEHTQTEKHSSHEGTGTTRQIIEESEHEHMHETEGPHVHNSTTAEAAQWVGVATLLVAVPVFAIRIRSPNKLVYKDAVLTLALGAGIMHLLLSPDHFVDAGIEHGIFFATAGVAQIGFGSLFMVRPIRKLAIIGAAGIIGSIILYFITRIENLPGPFGAPEGIDPVGIIAKIAEVSLVVLLIYLATHLRKAKSVEYAKAGLNLSRM